MDTNEQRQESQQNRREERHKRRQRSQIIAYTVVGIMILVLAAGIAFAVSKITGMNHDRQEQQNKLDDIIASEETITAPTEPVETVPELTNEQKLDKIIDEAIIQNMPLEDKVAGLFITTPESITGVSAAVQAGDGTKDALSKYPVGGIVYAAKNSVRRPVKADDRQYEAVYQLSTVYCDRRRRIRNRRCGSGRPGNEDRFPGDYRRIRRYQ